MKRHPLAPAPQSLDKLKASHEAALERYRRILSIPFQRRAEWLVKHIQKELPNVGGLVYCNGSSWLQPLNENDDTIPYHDPDHEEDEPAICQDRMREALTFAAGYGRTPAVTPKCLRYMRELYELAGYCEDSRMSTLNVVVTI